MSRGATNSARVQSAKESGSGAVAKAGVAKSSAWPEGSWKFWVTVKLVTFVSSMMPLRKELKLVASKLVPPTTEALELPDRIWIA